LIYDIGKVAEITHVSKVTIYRKLKLQEIKPFIITKNNKQFLDEKGINIIKEMLNVTTDEITELNSKDIEQPSNPEIAISITDLMSVKDTLIESLQSNSELLKKELDIKNNQIESLHKLIENNQILLKEKPQQDIRLLEEHFQDLDTKLMDIKEQMNVKDQPQEGFFKRIFKK